MCVRKTEQYARAEYGFFYYFYQDASMAHEIKLTGILSTGFILPGDEEGSAYSTRVAPGIEGPYHQHIFCARIDMAVDDPEGGKGLVVKEVSSMRLWEKEVWMGAGAHDTISML